MTKQISITIRDYIYDSYIKGYNGNVSALFEEMLVKGIDNESGEMEGFKLKYYELLKQNREIMEENRQIKSKLGKIRVIHDKTTQNQAEINSPLDKCFNCGSYIEGKINKFPKGIICQPCFKVGRKGDFIRWGVKYD